MFGPDGNCVSPETGLHLEWTGAGPPELWRKPVGSGYSTPVLAGDDLILLHRIENRELLSCYSAESGQPRWEHAWPTTYQCKYLYSNGPYGSPLIDGDLVFAAGAQGRLVCVTRETHSLLWERDLFADLQLQQGLFAFGPGLATDDARLYLNAGGVDTNSGIVALDKCTGETVWTATDHAMAYTLPRLVTVHGRRLLLVLTETGLACLDPDSGSEHWTYPFHAKGADTINAVTPAVQDDLVLIVAGPGPGAVACGLKRTSQRAKSGKTAACSIASSTRSSTAGGTSMASPPADRAARSSSASNSPAASCAGNIPLRSTAARQLLPTAG